MKPKPTPESEIVKALLLQFAIPQTVSGLTICLERHNVGAQKVGDRFIRSGVAGDPDLQGEVSYKVAVHSSCCDDRGCWSQVPARRLHCEVKNAHGKLSPVQEQRHEALRKRGCIVIVYRPTKPEWMLTLAKDVAELIHKELQ